MPAPKTQPKADEAEAPAAQFGVEKLLADARELHQEKVALFEARAKNREPLRLFQNAGALTPEQSAEVNKIYPPRKRKGKDNGSDESAE